MDNTIVVYLSTLLLIIFLLLVLPLILSYRETQRSYKSIDKVTKAEQGKLDIDKTSHLYETAAGISKIDMTAYVRTTISILALTIVAISIFELIEKSQPQDFQPAITSLLGVLAGLFSAVVGFYFGSKATETTQGKKEKDEEKKRPC